MKDLPRIEDPNLLVGFEEAADAAVYRIDETKALVCTLDFFTPIVDDPYYFGQIAAANALSDIYVMGAEPLLALNIVCFPRKEMDRAVLKKILQGGYEKVFEAGALLVGGHSLEDREIKYGLSVVGLVHPEKLIQNKGAQPGDCLILTKPLGTGIIATAVKGAMASEAVQKKAIEIMAALNKPASEAMKKIGVHAATDITGFGLLGHSVEMARASRVSIHIEAHKVPIIPEALEYVRLGLIPAGDLENKKFCAQVVEIDPGLDPALIELLYDAQTSGGLLIAVEESKAEKLWEELLQQEVYEAAIIGKVTEQKTPLIKVTP